MRYRALPHTDVTVSEVGFGVWTLATGWWGDRDDREAVALLRAALERGVTLYDTADSYGNGRGETILAEAALSYLGLGTQPPQPSWGRMLSEAQTLMFQAPLLAVFPGVAIALAVLGLNLLGDGLRDLFDPRLARKR